MKFNVKKQIRKNLYLPTKNLVKGFFGDKRYSTFTIYINTIKTTNNLIEVIKY